MPRMKTIITLLLTAFLMHAADQLVDDHVMKVTTPATVVSTRKALVDFIWGTSWAAVQSKRPEAVQRGYILQPGDAMPAHLDNLKSVDRLDVSTEARTRAGRTETITSTAFILHPAKQNLHKAVIVHHGHGCEMVDTGKYPVHLELLIRELVSAGYTVAAMRMPLFQSPSHCGVTRVHDRLFDAALQDGSPLKFFMEPVARTVNYLAKQEPPLKEIDMIGLSGGGWTTTVYAALDPRVMKSFPVAGTVPLYMRNGHYNHDLEQYFSPVYRLAGYKDLYVLGAAGKGRLQLQILNRYDDCCFGERQHLLTGVSYSNAVRRYESEVRTVLGRMQTGGFAVHLDESAHYHQISQQAIREVILPVLGGGVLPER